MNYSMSIMEASSNLGERLRQLINHLELSVAKFSKEIGVPQPTITSYLNDSREPGISFLMKIKNRYKDVNLNWIITGEGSMERDSDKRYEELRDKYYTIVEEQLNLYKKLNEVNSN